MSIPSKIQYNLCKECFIRGFLWFVDEIKSISNSFQIIVIITLTFTHSLRENTYQ